MTFQRSGWFARIVLATGATGATWLAIVMSAWAEQGHVGLLSTQEKLRIVATQTTPAPVPCYNVTSLICGSATANGTPTPCGSSTYPTCSGSSEGGCSGTNTSYECYSVNGGGRYSQCPTFNTLPGNTNCGYATTAGGCSGFTSRDGTNGCVATGGRPYSPNQGCGPVNGTPRNAVLPGCPN